jgi:hypothetical protein
MRENRLSGSLSDSMVPAIRAVGRFSLGGRADRMQRPKTLPLLTLCRSFYMIEMIVIYIWFSKGRDVIPWKAVRAEKHSNPGWMLSSTG